MYSSNNDSKILIYYQSFLAIAAVLVFFTRITVYLEQELGIGIPLYWIFVFCVGSIPLLFTHNRLKHIPVPIIIWIGAYLGLSLLSILISPLNFQLQLLEDQIRSIIFLLLMLLIFSQHPSVIKHTKFAVLFVTIVNVFMFVYEFFNPLAYYLSQHSPGRASGFYINSNAASVALIVGMILTIDLFKPKYRLLYSLFVLLGIATTFSRGSTIGWMIVVSFFLFTNVVSKTQLPLLLLFAFTSLTILSTQISNLTYLKTADGNFLFQEDTIARVEFLIDPLGQEDSSSQSRIGYVEESWRKFARRPFTGNGLGSGASDRQVSAQGTAQRSHNIYLDLMVEYGFLGFFTYPLLLVATVWKAQGETRKITVPFIVFSLFIGIFNHTALSAFASLTSYAIMANITEQSRDRNLPLSSKS